MTNQQFSSETLYVSKEILEKFREELEDRKTNKRQEIAQHISEAKELGDLSENAEYSQAKDEQAFNEGRIIELENIISKAKVASSHIGSKTVRVGSTVSAKVNDSIKDYTLVGLNEADPINNKISNQSPLGQALMDRMAGDSGTFKAPNGEVSFKILKIK
ncbi:MAG: transcription elongation factor GreA [Patescibacteria group bacterium]|nr:transcription elongation factor GreA [Patescibacteria group bacterium]